MNDLNAFFQSFTLMKPFLWGSSSEKSFYNNGPVKLSPDKQSSFSMKTLKLS